MKITLWAADKGYESVLGPAIIAGAALHGDDVTVRDLADYQGPEGDAGMIFGVVRREVLWDHQRRGQPIIYLDKGFFRAREIWRGSSLPAWWRVCINETHPTAYLMDHERPSDRWRLAGLSLHERRHGSRIVIAGSSQKFHHTMGLAHPTLWASDLVREIRRHTDAEIVYRPKPSWKDAEPIPGTTFDHGAKTPFPVTDVACVVTYGSIASVDAVLAGLPVIVLGNAAAAPIASRDISAVADPWWPAQEQRVQWVQNLAYCHWRPEELTNGIAWTTIKEQLADAL